jgi:integrase
MLLAIIFTLSGLYVAVQIEDEPDEIIRDFVWILLSTGVRKTNVLEMRWDQLDLPNGIWTISDTKNGTSQTILLTEKELEILNRRHSAGRDFQWVFPSTGASGHLADPKKGWLRILDRAKITNLHLHDLRRSLGSYMAMTGASLSVIGNVLNHKDVSTTRKVYAQSAREAERSARLIAHARMFGSTTANPSTPNAPASSDNEAAS